MQWVDEHPEWETEPFDSDFREEYGASDSLGRFVALLTFPWAR